MDETGDRLDRLIRSSSALRAEAERLRLCVQDTVGKDAFGVAPLNRRTAARLTPEAGACPTQSSRPPRPHLDTSDAAAEAAS
jgi:hypothetical protein